MPIKIPDTLPARSVLESERIFVMGQGRAEAQDIRPLKILILNLMPLKITTETQLLRCLSNTPLQIEIDLLQTSTYHSKHTPEDHLLTFYLTFDQICDKLYDGMIITGAPVELMEFEQVDYWEELCTIMEWSKAHVFSTFHICWGAQAALYYHYGIEKAPLASKMFGVFRHTVLDPTEAIFRGFDDFFFAPHSRHTEVRISDVVNEPRLKLLSVSPQAGFYMACSRDYRQFFVMGHSEYDRETLAYEYFRDVKNGTPIALPTSYFSMDDPDNPPVVTWRSHGQLLYTNWLNYYVYQATPYDLASMEGKGRHQTK